MLTIKCYYFLSKNVFGTAPDPAWRAHGLRWGAHVAPPDSLVGWGGENPLPIPHSFDDFGVSAQSLWRLGPGRL